jgi:hypothetical protein
MIIAIILMRGTLMAAKEEKMRCMIVGVLTLISVFCLIPMTSHDTPLPDTDDFARHTS